MANTQQWMDQNYPQETRNGIKELGIDSRELEGHLDLRDFVNLEKLNCSINFLISIDLSENKKLIEFNCLGNSLTELNLRNNKNLEKIVCSNNQLINLDLSGCENLQTLEVQNVEIFGQLRFKYFNQLSDVNFLSQLPNPEKLNSLHLWANSISSDLTPFGRFINLENLSLGVFGLSKETTEVRGNRLRGSLEPLKSLVKLKSLDISNTDIEGGLEYLSDSIETLYCSTKERSGSRVKQLAQELRKFGLPPLIASHPVRYSNYAPLLPRWKAASPEKVKIANQAWEIERLRTIIRKKDTEIAELTKKSENNIQEENLDLKSKLTDSRQKLARVEDKLEARNREIRELTRQLEELQANQVVDEQSLNDQLQTKTQEFEQLITSIESKLNEDEKESLEGLLEAQEELAKNENNTFAQKQLTRNRRSLSKKLDEQEIQTLLEKNTEVNELGKQVASLQIQENDQFQAQVETTSSRWSN